MIDVVLEITRITQAVSMVSTASEQVSVIVREISRCLDVDVCTLYRINGRGDYILVASHGLSATRPVKIPAKQGLVGLVATRRHTINLANGVKRPEYYRVVDIKEERFKSFCGAPLVSNGEVIGVLVVQSSKAKKLSLKNEAFMTTMASHIALIVKQIPAFISGSSTKSMLKGISASEGIAIGAPYILVKAGLDEVSLSYHQDEDHEIMLWRQLIETVLKDLNRQKKLLENNLSTEITNMFDAYNMLLLDQTLSDRVEAGIHEGFSLQTSLRHAITYFAELFQQMDDAYLKARSEDVWHVGNKLYQTFLGDSHAIPQFDDPVDIVLIANEVSVSDIAEFQLERLKAIVCSGGSHLSHTAIVANALGIPAIMGVQNLLEQPVGDLIIVDGKAGILYLRPTPSVLREFREQIIRQKEIDEELDSYRLEPALTKNGTRIQLFANSGLLSDISPGIKHGAEGIGLFRTEIPFIISDTFPTENEQIEIYRNVFSNYVGKPVYMRTLDVGGDKQLPYFPISGEDNPAMGWRGIRFTLDNVQLLVTQIRAMLRAAGKAGNLKIILPMVSSTSELIAFQEVLADALNQLTNENKSVTKPEVGVMIEVPAGISQLKFWAKHIDFVSIGANDLSQYLLAIDRNNPKVASRFDHVHPAVICEIQRIVDSANNLELPVSVCGEMASDAVAVVLLLAMGITKLSVSSSKIPRLKALIGQLDEQHMQHFLDFALQQDSADKIRKEGESLLKSLQTD